MCIKHLVTCKSISGKKLDNYISFEKKNQQNGIWQNIFTVQPWYVCIQFCILSNQEITLRLHVIIVYQLCCLFYWFYHILSCIEFHLVITGVWTHGKDYYYLLLVLDECTSSKAPLLKHLKLKRGLLNDLWVIVSHWPEKRRNIFCQYSSSDLSLSNLHQKVMSLENFKFPQQSHILICNMIHNDCGKISLLLLYICL